MSTRVRRHNSRASLETWWRRYHWAKREFWAKHACHEAARKAAASGRTRDRAFWRAVERRAADHCRRFYGPVPSTMIEWNATLKAWVTSHEASAWLRLQPPASAWGREQWSPVRFRACRL